MSDIVNAEAERALIARLLLDPAQIPFISGKVKADEFGIPEYGKAFSIMVRLSNEDKPVDIVTIRAAGAEIDPLELTGAHRGALEGYAAIIRDNAFRRKVVAAADRVIRAAEFGDDRLMDTVQGAFAELAQGADPGKLVTSSDAVDEYLEEMALRLAGEETGLTYGVPGLDELLLPLRSGELAIVAARPGVGKSALALALAHHWAGRGTVLYVSLEMDKNQIIDRLASRVSGIGAGKIIRGDLDDREQEEVRSALEKIRQLPIDYLDDGFATSASVRSTAARVRMQAGGKLAAIIVDYLGLLNDPGDSEVQRIGRITRQLKGLSRDAGCPVLALSQLNRQVEMREDKHPRLSDLRDSGAVEQDADVVLALTRDMDSPWMDIEVLKQRQGGVGRLSVHFSGDTSTFSRPSAQPVWRVVPKAAPAEESGLLNW